MGNAKLHGEQRTISLGTGGQVGAETDRGRNSVPYLDSPCPAGSRLPTLPKGTTWVTAQEAGPSNMLSK